MKSIMYYVIYCIIILILVSGFATGFYVGKNIATSSYVFHSHIVSHVEPDPLKLPMTYDNEKEEPISSVVDIEDEGEFDCMAKTIYFEAGNQSYQGKLAVGKVVINRVNDKRYPNSVCKVIKQNRQFSWYWDGKPDEPVMSSPTWKESKRAAREVLCRCDMTSTVFNDPSVQYYHADYVNPKWAGQKKRVAKIDNHIFYR